MKNALLLGGVAAAVLGAAIGGYYLNEARVCRGLEEDFINAAVGQNDAYSLAQIGDQKLARAAKLLIERDRKATDAAMQAIFDRCGSRATMTAIRKFRQELPGGAL